MDLTWSMKVENGKLVVDYTVTNQTAEPIHVADKLLVARNNMFEPAPDALIVMNGERPGQVRLVKGAVSADAPSAVIYPPLYKRVAPGQSAHGTARLTLPLKAWHNFGRVEPLRDPSTATLEVQYFSGEPPQWRTLPSSEDKTVRVPEGMAASLAHGAEQPIPN